MHRQTDILRSRRKARGWQLPRWQEPGPDLLKYIVTRVQSCGAHWKVALHLSNLQGVDFTTLPQVFPPPELRHVLDGLCKGPSKGVELLSRFSGGGIVTWAPQESDALQRLVATFTKYTTEVNPTSECRIVLLIPHDVYPDCDSPAHILDLWWHPLLGDKYNDVVKEVTFLRQPSCCVFSGEASPNYHSKALAMVTLAGQTQASLPSMIHWRPTLLTTGDNFTVVVDCPSDQAMNIRRALTKASIHGLTCWEGPLRSLGTQGKDRRVAFYGYLPRSAATLLDVRLCIAGLRRRPDLKEALIGSQSFFSDSSALLADISNPSAATRIADLCEQLVIVSPRLVLLHTSQPKDTWELRLTELVREDASKSIGRVHWRKSGHGCRVFAKPLALDIQVRAARAKAHPQASRGIEHDPSLSSMIVIRGVLGADPAKLTED